VSPPHRATPEGRAYLDLQSRSKKDGRTTQQYLQLYCLEGFLARLVASGYTRRTDGSLGGGGGYVRGHKKVPGFGRPKAPLMAMKVPAGGHQKSPLFAESGTCAR
jgi:hypothetical protein